MKDWRKTWAFRIALSRVALFWEGAWPALWPAVQVAGLFLLVALLDILPTLPGWLHGGLLLIFSGALLWALWNGIRALRIPDGPSAERRLEQVNNLSHRPFDALDDEIATPDPHGEGAQLWQLHRARMAKMLQGIRAGWPQPRLIRRDPFATRIVLGAVLVMSAFAAGRNAPAHLLRAVAPE